MKQIAFFLFLAALFLACDKQCTCIGYAVNQTPCECVIFQGKIGNDFDLALDSLKKHYEPEFKIKFEQGFYSGKGYFVEKYGINVDFDEDDRLFFQLIFRDSLPPDYKYLVTSDIIDEKGNYYVHTTGLRD